MLTRRLEAAQIVQPFFRAFLHQAIGNSAQSLRFVEAEGADDRENVRKQSLAAKNSDRHMSFARVTVLDLNFADLDRQFGPDYESVEACFQTLIK